MAGEASGLFVKHLRVKGVLIFYQPLPQELSDLDWIWKNNTTCSKLLGIFVGMEILPLMMGQALLQTLEDRLDKAKKYPHLLAKIVAIANQLINSSMWYMLAL